VTGFITDALKDKCPDIKKRLEHRIRAHARSVKRRRAREAAVAYGRHGRSIDRRGGEWARMRNALMKPEEIAAAPTPQPWQLIDTLDRDWLEEQLRAHGVPERFKRRYRLRFLCERTRKRDHVGLAPLQRPGWSREREAEWEKTWEKSSSGTPSVVPSDTRAVVDCTPALVSSDTQK
jgi:hypothetical protein